MTNRFQLAMACYAFLALGAGFQLDGKVRAIVLILLAALALKTWVHQRRTDK